VQSVGDAREAEGDVLVHTVTLSGPTSNPTTYSFALTGGTATEGADFTSVPQFSDGVTYDPVTGTITVPAGVTSFTVSVLSVDDIVAEADESYTVSVGGQVGTGTIVDNEGAPTINISGPAIVDEAAGTATYTVTLSHASAGPVTVDYASADGSATAGSDYDATSGTLSFAPGTTSLTHHGADHQRQPVRRR
jgi:hypothetical protein